MFSTLIKLNCRIIVAVRTIPSLQTFTLVNGRHSSSDTRPKKPLSSYLVFCQEKRPQIITNSPELSFGEVGRQLGEEWKKLSDLERQTFDIRAKELLEEYQQQKDDFESNLSGDELAEIENVEHQRKLSRQKRRTKAEMKRLAKPKRPKNSFALFLSEHFVKGENPAAQMSRLADTWRTSSEQDKLHYQQEASKQKENYEIEMEAWKIRMIAEGREDLFQTRQTKKQSRKKIIEDWEEE